jgi:hypothetical protein
MKFICIFVSVLIFCNNARAQVTVTEKQAMSFGSMIVGSTGDTVTISLSGDIQSTNFSDFQGGHSPAVFLIQGEPDEAVFFSFSTNDQLTGNGETLNLQALKADLSNPFILNSQGQRELKVGASLIIPPGINGGNFTGNFMLIIDNQ